VGTFFEKTLFKTLLIQNQKYLLTAQHALYGYHYRISACAKPSFAMTDMKLF